MINLVSISIKNFLSIESMEIAFPKPGNFIITGYNEPGGDSNGSGKSTILNAIIWALFGKTAKGLRGSDVIRWSSSGGTQVLLRLADDRGRIYDVTRTDRSVSFKIDGVETGGHKLDIQQTINETFHTNYDLALSSIMFTKGQADFLTDSGDAAKKRLFKSILRLEKIDKMYDKVKEEFSNLNTKAEHLEYTIGSKESVVADTYKELQSLNDKLTSWGEQQKAHIRKLKEEIAEEAPVIDETLENRLEGQKSMVLSLELQVKEAEEVAPFLSSELAEAYKSVGYYKILLETLEKEFMEAESQQGGVCRYCGSKITKRGFFAHLDEINQKIVDARKDLTKYTEQMYNLEQTVSRLDTLRVDYALANKEYLELQMMVSVQRQKIESFKATKGAKEKTIQLEETKENPYESVVKDKTSFLQTLEGDVAILRKQFIEVIGAIDIYGFLKWVLSREGVVSVIIEKTFSRLQALINRYLSAVCTEGFFVELKPKKELKSGAMKDEIDIVITQKGRKVPYAALSSGQEQRVTIAALLALYKLSKELGMNRFGFLLLDEVLDLSLAEKGQQDIIRLLEGMITEIRNVLVISHKDALVTEFPFQINVRRGMDEVTYLEGVFCQ